MAAEDFENQEKNAEEEDVSSSVRKKKAILWILPVFLLFSSVIGVYFSGIADNFINVGGDEKAQGEKAETPEKEREPGGTVFFDVPEMLVNLNVTAGHKPVYFKVKITLELERNSDAEQVEKLLPRVSDSLQFYLREMRLDEVQGSMGTYRLKEEIAARLSKILSPVKIKDVLFKEILIQ